MKRTNLACISLLLSAYLFAGCSKPSVPKKMSFEDIQQARLDWNVKTLVTAYQNAGNSDPVWDKAAVQALMEFAKIRTQVVTPDEPWAEIIDTNCDNAVKAGCNDPMVRYLYLRFGLSQTNTPKLFSDSYDALESDMQKSDYPPVRKFYVSLRALQQFLYAYGYNNNSADYSIPGQLLNDAVSSLVAALNDKTMPAEEGYEACSELIKALPGDPNIFQSDYDKIEKPLFDNWPNEATSWLLKGQAYYMMGWIDRGSGYADTVTKQGFKGIDKNLAIAEKALNRAWELNPTDARTAVAMIRVETGLGTERDQMEIWFNRAMENDPDDYDACSAKLNYLEPKWFGSVEDMLEFGRECAQSTNWGGTVPLILVDAHYEIYNQFIDPSEQTNYWKEPDVWADISSAYEQYLQSYPRDTYHIAYYARYAYFAEQWDKLNELLPKVGPDNYYIFGGKDQFDEIVQITKEHVSQQ